MRFFLSVFILFSGLILRAQDNINLNGIWRDSTSTEFTNCYAVISQDGNKITINHYLEWKGQPFVESGKGTLKGRNLQYKVKVTLQIKGWATKGVHELILSSDGKTLRGSYKDNAGNSGPIVLKRFNS